MSIAFLPALIAACFVNEEKTQAEETSQDLLRGLGETSPAGSNVVVDSYTSSTGENITLVHAPDKMYRSAEFVCDKNRARIEIAGTENTDKFAPLSIPYLVIDDDSDNLSWNWGTQAFPQTEALFSHPQVCGKKPVEATASTSGEPVTYFPTYYRPMK